MEESFGVDLHELTSRSLSTIREALSPPACVVDYGAGTGRLAIPLARVGFDVTAVDDIVTSRDDWLKKLAALET